LSNPRRVQAERTAAESLRLRRLMQSRLLLGLLLSLLLRVLFGKVPPNNAAAHRANHRVMPRVVTGNPADHRALDATGRIGISDRYECQNGA
jgi:hypothetical protein